MVIAMQGNWTVKVKSKSAAYNQRFVISGATSGNGIHSGTGPTSVNVTGDQWSIAIQNDPGSGYQLSDTKIQFPKKIGSVYQFEIWSNDAGGDEDFNDLVLACSTPVNVNEFIIYGNVSLYKKRCIFNPCRKGPFVIETKDALREALKNSRIREILKKQYPARTIEDIIGPLPPDPPPFKPIVIDLNNEAVQPKPRIFYKKSDVPKVKTKGKVEEISKYSVGNYIFSHKESGRDLQEIARSVDKAELARVIEGLMPKICTSSPAANATFTFEEYDRTAAEKNGGAYTGTGNRRLLGSTITDMLGNYIFRFSFDMEYPGFEDSSDIAPGETMDVVVLPDVIVKLLEFSPYKTIYESAPYYNIPNLKRIDLCLPESAVKPPASCFNGNLIGSLGNVFLGGNQNSTASTSDAALRRYQNGNYLEASGIISVGSSLAGFNIECAPWCGTIDFKGCMYDHAKTVLMNKAKWYTIRIKRDGVGDWQFVSQNYKHPKFHKRNLPGYIGDDVGPFFQKLRVDGVETNAPAYINIQRQIVADGIDWEFSNSDRYMRLNTMLYDLVAGERVPGKFYVRVDCYDGAGEPVPGGTDMIALYIHNNPLGFGLAQPVFTDSSIVNSGCGLFRLTDAQMNAPIRLSFKANDPDSKGFLHFFDLSLKRCPAPMIALTINQPATGSTPPGPTPQPHPTTPASRTTLFNGMSTSEHSTCVGYTGTIEKFVNADMINVEIQPSPSEGGWIRPTEYFTSLSFYLLAYKRQTNGYNSGLSDAYEAHAQILMERITS